MTIKVQEINNNYRSYRNFADSSDEKSENTAKSVQKLPSKGYDSVSFKKKGGKRFWLIFRQLSDYMKEPSEMTNAIVAAVGTGGIAPIAIMCSPGKKTTNAEDKKKERGKKAFQAARQPVSAALAFGFQVPTTIGIAKGLNTLAYEQHKPFFNDEVLGTLIPDKKYLKKQAKNVLKGRANQKVKDSWKQELEGIKNDAALLQNEFTEKLKEDYTEVNMNISENRIKAASKNTKKKNKFLAEKMADAKHKRLLSEKVDELIGKNFEIKDLDLVTEGYQDLAKLRHKADFDKLRADAKLSPLDNFIDSMGFKNKKLRKLEEAEKKLAKDKGLELLKKDVPDAFKDGKTRLKYFVENRNVKAQKLYANKIFWLTLVTNLFMVAISCIALNWIHPKFARAVEGIKQKHDEKKEQKKVEVSA